MFKSATRIVLFILTVTLCVLLFKTLRNQEQFSIVFKLFETVLSAMVGFFIAKSTQQNKETFNIEK